MSFMGKDPKIDKFIDLKGKRTKRYVVTLEKVLYHNKKVEYTVGGSCQHGNFEIPHKGNCEYFYFLDELEKATKKYEELIEEGNLPGKQEK